MAKKPIIQLDNKELKQLEKFVKERIEYVVFNTRRPRKKVKGGHKIEDDSGDLRRSIRNASNFITQSNKGLTIELKTMKYYKYLDDERRDELNWYLSESIFEDKLFRDKIREILKGSGMRTITKLLSKI